MIGPGSNVVLADDPFQNGVGWIVTAGANRYLVHWPGDRRAWHRPEELTTLERLTLSNDDLISLLYR